MRTTPDPVSVTDEEAARLIAGAEQAVLVFFSRRALESPGMPDVMFEELLEQAGVQVPSALVDVDEHRAVAQAAGLAVLPALVVFRRNVPVARVEGIRPLSEVVALLRQALTAPTDSGAPLRVLSGQEPR